MDSSPTTLAGQNTISPAVSGRRTPSFSSSSSFSSCSSYFHDDSSPLSPATPLRFISGVPFSWEKLPGIPKKLHASKKGDHDESTLNLLLPLPPSTATPAASKRHILPKNGNKKIKNHVQHLTRDPFFAALVECSKQDQQEASDDHHNMWSGGAKVSRSISDRLGFINLYTSCKNTCAVSESIIYLPRSARTSHYDLLNRGSHQNYYRDRFQQSRGDITSRLNASQKFTRYDTNDLK